MRCRPRVSHSCQHPLPRLLSHHVPPPPLAHSLAENEIGDEGASALAAVLKETKITNLKCAAAPECLLSCQRPLTRLLSHTVPILPLARSLGGNDIGVEGATALAAILNETEITNLKCAAAPAVFAFMSAPIDTALNPANTALALGAHACM